MRCNKAPNQQEDGGIKIDNKSYLGSDVNHLGGADGGQMSNQV